jgi:hypothetical protein
MERKRRETGKVLKVEHDGDRTLLYLDFGKGRLPISYYAIAGKECTIQKNDIITYEPDGVNFGWFVKKVSDDA